MAQSRRSILRGISEVGARRASVDVSFGRTAEDGVEIAFTGSDVKVRSGQSTWPEDMFRTEDDVEIRVRLLYADLLNLKDLLGLPDAALTGDLWAGSPTPEVLTATEAQLGSREDIIYVICPGPRSTRRYEFARCKLNAGTTIGQGKNQEVQLEATWTVLRPLTGNPFTFTDAV